MTHNHGARPRQKTEVYLPIEAPGGGVERCKALDACGVSRQKSASEAPCGACLPQSAWFV